MTPVSGLRTIVLRAGDFIEPTKTGNWFDSHITAKSERGQTLYPGPLESLHAWAYLPDMARAAVGLAERRQRFDCFEEFGFSGFGVTGQMLVDQIAVALGKPQRIKKLPWAMLRLIGVFAPNLREVFEMRYLWRVPHVIDGAKLAAALPDFTPTSFGDAIKASLAGKAT